MAEAAERRAGAEENRGVKDASSVKRMEQKRDELEKRQNEQVGQDETVLKVCFYMSQLYFVIIWYIYCFRMKVNKRKTRFVRDYGPSLNFLLILPLGYRALKLRIEYQSIVINSSKTFHYSYFVAFLLVSRDSYFIVSRDSY